MDTNLPIGLTWFALALSFILAAADLGLFLYWRAGTKLLSRLKLPKKLKVFAKRKNSGRRLMIFAVLLLGAVWALRFAIGNYSLIEPSETIPGLNAGEQFLNSFLHALQTFSMDEAYTEYLLQGKKLIALLCGDGAVPWFSGYILALNVMAPVAGGAFVFEILANIFPQLHYYVSLLFFWKKRYFFTALNDQSLALAKSIAADPEEKHVSIVFTDAYAENENEESTERLLSAKARGAICLKDDLLHIPLKWLGKERACFFLSDLSENENLQTLTKLLSPDKQSVIGNAKIYVFGSDKKFSCIEDEVVYLHDRLSAEYARGDEPLVSRVTPVNGIRNMAQSLFYKLPLFECLYGKEGEDRQINLTIVGSGVIGTELFLNAYWFGQMAGVKLNVTMVSREEEKAEFISRIDFFNPDIMATAETGNPLLDARLRTADGAEEKRPQPPYFHFRYLRTDISKNNLDKLLSSKFEDGFQLRDTDYFIIALGSDDDNFLVANRLRQKIGRYHLSEETDLKTIISYVIYNPSLCKTLNYRARHKYTTKGSPADFDVYMHAFGSMDELYCVDNVLRGRLQRSTGTAAGDTNPADKMILQRNSYYSEKSAFARKMHVCYKSYLAGFLEPSLFRSASDDDYNAYLEKCEDLYLDAAMSKTGAVTADGKELLLTPGAAADIAWTENRRWNAYLRINGFRCPAKEFEVDADIMKTVDAYYGLNSDVHDLTEENQKKKPYQFFMLKVHPCIVECDRQCYPNKKDPETGKRQKMDLSKCTMPDELDRLGARTGTDFKTYDYPEYDVPKDRRK